MTTYDDIKEELLTAIANGEDLDSIRDSAGEWVDGFLPIYNNEIIKEWQEMPGDYDDRGGAELGHMGETTIVGLMSLDLYLYYSDLLALVLDNLEEE